MALVVPRAIEGASPTLRGSFVTEGDRRVAAEQPISDEIDRSIRERLSRRPRFGYAGLAPRSRAANCQTSAQRTWRGGAERSPDS